MLSNAAMNTASALQYTDGADASEFRAKRCAIASQSSFCPAHMQIRFQQIRACGPSTPPTLPPEHACSINIPCGGCMLRSARPKPGLQPRAFDHPSSTSHQVRSQVLLKTTAAYDSRSSHCGEGAPVRHDLREVRLPLHPGHASAPPPLRQASHACVGCAL